MSTSDHFDGRRFFNPAGPEPQPFTAVPRMLLERRTKWPKWIDASATRPPRLDGATATITFIGHATFLIQTAAGNILTDPLYSARASPLQWMGPRRVRPPGIRFEDLPEISIVLLSHNHYDHCDVPTLRRLARRFDPRVVTPLGNGSLVRSTGIHRVEELDWWENTQSSGLSITSTPAHHFSARGPFDRDRALWSGFVISIADACVYFAGDTAYGDFFKAIAMRLGPITLALLPIGAYEPRWFMRAVHMNPAEAVRAHLDLGSAQSIGMHFGTIQLTTEGIDDPLHALQQAREERQIQASEFRALEIGESVRINETSRQP